MRYVVVLGSKGTVVESVYDTDSMKDTNDKGNVKIPVKAFDGIVPDMLPEATRINVLSIVVNAMEKIALDKKPTVLITCSLVTDTIQKQTYKYWLFNGKKFNGRDVNATEIQLWKKFIQLDKQVGEMIIYKDSAKCIIPRKPRYAVTAEVRTEANLVSFTWDNVKATANAIVASFAAK